MEEDLSSPSSFGEQAHNRARGRLGEDAAVSHLVEQGYRIVERNVVTKAGEIDVVAEDAETLCFVEVKAREDDRHGPAVAAVGVRKQARVVRSAALYLAAREGPEVAVRFDVLGLEMEGGKWRFTLLRNAFEADSLYLV